MRSRRFGSPSSSPPSRPPRSQHAVAGIGAAFGHFVETERELDAPERATLGRILTHGPHDGAANETSEFLLVVPRRGTMSPWSAKATDMARNFGFETARNQTDL